ncbi:MAG TPA: DinB family protein [Pirellulaceae bacterium]
MQPIELELARKQIEFAREYTKLLFADVGSGDWFTCPAGAPTHLAWQMGHLAMAQYGLTLLRVRGKLEEDGKWISNDFMRCFKKGSQPQPDPSQYPDPEVIRATFDRVYRESMAALESYRVEDLEETVPMPYAVYANKLGSILFCPAHEMLHAGQIGLLRRLLGKEPLR